MSFLVLAVHLLFGADAVLPARLLGLLDLMMRVM